MVANFCILLPLELPPFVSELVHDVVLFRQATYAENTKKSYRTHRKAYECFCSQMSSPLVPASTDFLCLYIAHLARFLLPQSVCMYLNFVGLLHLEMGYANPLTNNWTLSTVLKGMKRMLGVPAKPRLPITTALLLFGIRSRLNLNCSFHASFWAVCLVSFFGLFRKSHLLPASSTIFNPLKQLVRSDFTFHDDHILVLVRWSKTIQLGQRTITVPLVAIPSSPLCPVRAILHAFSLTPGVLPDAQAFCWRKSSMLPNTVLTYRTFMSFMKKVLTELGCSTSQYGTHSFRRGGATFALEAGVPLDVISLLGDWKSDSMFLYLHMPLAQRFSAQRLMASHLA